LSSEASAKADWWFLWVFGYQLQFPDWAVVATLRSGFCSLFSRSKIFLPFRVLCVPAPIIYVCFQIIKVDETQIAIHRPFPIRKEKRALVSQKRNG
jgi:hypothetical protein